MARRRLQRGPRSHTDSELFNLRNSPSKLEAVQIDDSLRLNTAANDEEDYTLCGRIDQEFQLGRSISQANTYAQQTRIVFEAGLEHKPEFMSFS